MSRESFKLTLNEGLPKDMRCLVLEDQSDPIIDSYGRVTFFSVKLAGQRLPIYQPGTVMFETGVRANCQLANKAKRGLLQLNREIMSEANAMFLASFIIKLSQRYNCAVAKMKQFLGN